MPVGTEKMRNQKNTSDGKIVGRGVGEAQVGLDIVGGDAHEVYESHGEEAEHHRQKLYLFVHGC
jgi:hypothetical protein